MFQLLYMYLKIHIYYLISYIMFQIIYMSILRNNLIIILLSYPMPNI